MKNIKDTVTTICTIIIALSGAIVTASTQPGVTIPAWVVGVCSALGIAATSTIGYYTGKNSDGSSKTPAQVTGQIVEAPKAGDETVEIKS